MLFLITFFLIPLAVFPPISLSLTLEYILDFRPTNSVIGIRQASSLNFPIIFLLVLQ